MHDCGDWFETDPEVDRLAIADAALNPARTVRDRTDFAALHPERVVVLQPGKREAVKTGADIEGLGSRQAEHRFGQICFQSIEYRFAPTRGDSAGDTLDDPTHAVASLSHLFDELDHLPGRF